MASAEIKIGLSEIGGRSLRLNRTGRERVEMAKWRRNKCGCSLAAATYLSPQAGKGSIQLSRIISKPP